MMEWYWTRRLPGTVAERMLGSILVLVRGMQEDYRCHCKSALSRAGQKGSHKLSLSIFSPGYPSIYYQTRLSPCTTIKSLNSEGMLYGRVKESTEIQQGVVDFNVRSRGQGCD